jgi:hypothetical protein
MTRWRRRHAVPARAFVTPDRALAGGGAARFDRDLYKPLYVDFDDLFSLSLLDHTVAKAGERMVVKEMLPAAEQLWLRQEDASYVTELVLELNREGGR